MTSLDKTLFGFVSAFLTSVLWPSIPNISLIALASLVLILIACYRLSALVTGVLSGVIWVSLVGHYYNYSFNNDQYFSQNLLVQGEVLNLSSISSKQDSEILTSKLNMRLSKVGKNSFSFYPLFLRPKIRVTWYAPTQVFSQGDKLQLLVKLKPPYGLANEGGFDYQKWLVSQGIDASGYVRNSPSNKLLESNITHRQNLVDKLASLHLQHGRFIHALSYGDRRFLTKQDWNLLQNTGTAHLFAISGMHLAIVFGGCLLLFKTAYLFFVSVSNRLFNSGNYVGNYKKGFFVVSLTACFLYAHLAGLQIPVMRAWLTLCLIILLLLMGVNWSKTSVFLAMISIVAIVFPLSVLSLSFWFSICAVCLIVIYLWRFPMHSDSSFKAKMFYAIKLQVFLSIATLPFSLFFFDTLPLSALLSNLIMIPIITFFLLPLCLVASVLSITSLPDSALYMLLDWSFGKVMKLLEAIDETSHTLLSYIFSTYFHEISIQQFIFVLKEIVSSPLLFMLALILVLPPVLFQRIAILSMSLVCILAGIEQSTKAPQNVDAWHFIAFDVGQGSAHLIQSGNENILYDTGMGNGSFSMAQNVLLPYFSEKNIHTLKQLYISHFDNDHSGGLQTILDTMEVEEVLDPGSSCNRQSYAHNRDSQHGYNLVNNLKIEILWPLTPTKSKHNNNSCVIKISSQFHSVLLTGDIERETELELVEYYQGLDTLNSDVLVAPHHGSSTSSSDVFIDAVSPEYVVFSAGYRNRWNFPHEQVRQRYLIRGIQTYHTGNNGQLIFSFSNLQNNEIEVKTYRQDINPKWYSQLRFE